MSLGRLIYYGAIVGGWAAFLGWLAGEQVVGRAGWQPSDRLAVLAFAALVGSAIGAGLNLLAGMANGQLVQQVMRLGPGLIGGAVGGAVGALLGDVLYSAGLPRALGWMVMGAGIGVVEGLYERSATKLRNGLIGGAIGGAFGGVLFDVVLAVVRSPSGMPSRAVAFVVLGLCIGVLIAIVQVVLKQAWLTVVDGYRPRRELILTQPVTVLGRSESLPLPFFGAMSKNVEPEHARIVRGRDGRYVLEDNHTKIGTIVNKKVIEGPVTLQDGDLVRLGNNIVRFHEKRRDRTDAVIASTPPPARSTPPPVPPAGPTTTPPPVPKPSPVSSPPRPAPAPTATPAPTRAAAPPPPKPAAPPPPTSRPPVAPSRPAAPPPKPAAPLPTPSASPPKGCPGCGKLVPGPVGKRYCPTCHQRF